MATGPQAPGGGYSLTPETPSEDTTSGAGSTAHHEELLRTEALAARRGNRAVARFAVVGLVAALAVGVVTWRNSVPGEETPHDNVAEASSGSALRTTGDSSPASASVPSQKTSGNDTSVQPGSADQGGLVPLSEDPYLPPNAWNGGAVVTPQTGADQDTVTPTDTTGQSGQSGQSGQTETTTGDESRFPSIPGLPSLPDLPFLPEDDGASTTPTEPSEPTEDDGTDADGDSTSGSSGRQGLTEPTDTDGQASTGASEAAANSTSAAPTDTTDD